jgi:hypothetical protein
MNQLTVTQQKPGKPWIDETGNAIPYDRIKPSERANERKLPSLAKKRIALRLAIEQHKQECFSIGTELYQIFIDENGGKAPKSKGKGNITRYNFDRTIKIEINANAPIKFDESLLQLAKDKLDEMLNEGLEGAKDFIKPLIMDAFNNTGGFLDTKRVLGLRKYAQRIKDTRYHEAMDFIDQAIRRDDSKQYFSLYVKDEKGEYVDVHLNFANI